MHCPLFFRVEHAFPIPIADFEFAILNKGDVHGHR
jgi:hypothetical protein